MLAVVFLSLTFVILCLFYLNGKYNENYWKKRGVRLHQKNKVLGVLWDYITKSQAFFEHLHVIYKAYPNEPAVAIGTMLTPTLYIRDPVNVQYVLASNFNSFNHRGVDPNEDDHLANNILFLNGKKWKLIRQSMTPLFTSTKLKDMYYIMDKSAQDFIQYIKNDSTLLKGDMFNTLTTFCSAAICAAVFGVTTRSIFDSPFHSVARNAFKPTLAFNLKFALNSISSTLFKKLNIQLFKDYEEFFIGAIKQVVRQRERENVKKHDFADMCVSIQRNGTLKDPESGLEVQPTDELLAAQAFFFFVAGVEPTATSMFSTLVELGLNPKVKERLCSEVDDAFEKHDGKISYDVINDMEYLDMVMCEAMRIYPSIGFLTRKCVEDTVLPTDNIRVEKGTNMWVPIYELHHDPKYHPNPEKFDPERFSKENRRAMKDITYLPFGKGNRICVGMRYAQLQAKAGLVHLIRNFSFKTKIHEGGIKYSKEPVQVRITNVSVELIPRL